MKVIKTILNLIISFLLIIALGSAFLINGILKNYLNKDYVWQKLEEIKFFEQVSKDVTSGFEDYIYQSGLPEDTIKDLYTEDDIKTDVNSVLDYVYTGSKIKLSEEKVRTNLNNKINSFVEQEKRKLDSQEKKNIEKFEDLIVDSYVNNIKSSNTFIETVKEAVTEGNKIIEKINNIPIIVTVVLVILLIIINLKTIITGITYILISSLSIGILLKMFVTITLSKVDIDNLLIVSTSLSGLIQNIIRDVLNTLENYSMYTIIIGLTGIIIMAMIKTFGNKNNDKKQ